MNMVIEIPLREFINATLKSTANSNHLLHFLLLVKP